MPRRKLARGIGQAPVDCGGAANDRAAPIEHQRGGRAIVEPVGVAKGESQRHGRRVRLWSEGDGFMVT